MSSRRERAVALLERLVVARREVAELEAELDELLPDDYPGDGKRRKTTNPRSGGKSIFAQKGDVVPGSLPSKILAALDADPSRVFSARDLSHLAKVENVRSSLYRMAKNGQINAVDRGRYQSKKGGSAPEVA